MSELEDFIRDWIREDLRKIDRRLVDCPVCGELLHDGPCTRTDWPEYRGIQT